MADNKDFIKDGLGNDEIIETIKAILKRKQESDVKSLKDMERFEKVKVDFEFFADRYPMLFDLTLRDGEFDWNSLNYFLMMRQKIIDDKMTSEDASVKVGKEWFDKHVDVSKIHKNKKHKK